MKTILFIEGIYPINSRSQRIISTLGQEYSVRVVSWDRNNLKEKKEGYFIYSSTEGYGNRIKKLLGMKKYFQFVKSIYLVEKPDIIFVSQWDMLIFGYFLKKHKNKLVYDNIDMPASTNKFLWNVLMWIEKQLLTRCDMMIFSSRFFKENYDFFKKETFLLENLPLKYNNGILSPRKKSSKIRFAFIGTIRYYEILKKGIDVISSIEEIEYYFYGSGPDENKLMDYIKSKEYKNIYFKGKYEYQDIKKIYDNIDFVWAVYPNKDYNVKYAISNKFLKVYYMKKLLFLQQILI